MEVIKNTKKICSYCNKEILDCSTKQRFHQECQKNKLKKYQKKYRQLEHIKLKRKEELKIYKKSDKYKEYCREYAKRPYVLQRIREYQKKPEIKLKRRKYLQEYNKKDYVIKTKSQYQKQYAKEKCFYIPQFGASSKKIPKKIIIPEYKEELKKELPIITNKILNDCIMNPRKFLGETERTNEEFLSENQKRIQEKIKNRLENR